MSKLKAEIKLAMKKQSQLFPKRHSLNMTQPAQPHKTNTHQRYQEDAFLPLYAHINKRYSQKPTYPHLKNTYLKSNPTLQDQNNPAYQSQHLASPFRQETNSKSSFQFNKVLDNKIREIAEIKHLNIKAKQFIKVVNQHKSRAKGKFFYLRQKQEQKRNIKEQIESLQKTFIKYHYQQKRRREADEHIRLLNKRAEERSSKLAKPHLRQNSQRVERDIQKVSFYIHKQSPKQAGGKNNKQLARSDRTKTQCLEQQKPNLVLSEQDLKDLDQVRKKLIQLNTLMNKQQKFTRPQHDRY